MPIGHPVSPRLAPAAIGLLGLAVGFSVAPSAQAQATIRVRGAASLEAAATSLGNAVEVRGLLKDDAGRGIGNAHVRIELRAGESGPPLRLSAAKECAPSPMLHEARGFANAPDEVVVDTDTAGAFCVRMSDLGPPGILRLRFEDRDQFLDGVERWLPLDTLRRSLELRFVPEPSVVPLEREAQSVSVETRLRPVLNGEPPIGIGVELRLASGGQKTAELGRAQISAGERADFRFPSHALGRPGPATLIAAFAGSSTVQPVETSVVVMRTVTVLLDAPRSVAPGDPSDGIPLRVGVKNTAGGVPTGTVEARLGRETVGIAPLKNGRAELVVTFERGRGDAPAELELRYLPDAPWWVPGPPERIVVPISPPSAWRRVPWLLAAVIVGLWVIASWRRPVRTERRSEDRPAKRLARAAVRLVERRDQGSGWTGRVVDAHDGSEIAEAQVVVRRRTFQGDGVVASAVSDAEGKFALPPVTDTAEEGATIEVIAGWHSNFSAPLPAPGVLALELVSRRRTLLQRLVDWAGKKGAPWSDVGEPTPGHVARTAEGERQLEIARWAHATEEAAYGPNPPDADAEERVRTHEPGGAAQGRERAH